MIAKLKSIIACAATVAVLCCTSGCTTTPKQDVPQEQASAEAAPVYLFSYFVGNGEDGLHLAYSHDGYKWEPVKQGKSLLTPTVGENKLMRDPCVTQGPEGTYHMVWTTSWEGETLGYASSKDLINWSEQKAIPVMAHEQGVYNTWAPEINYNAATGEYIIYWSSTIKGRYPETVFVNDKGLERNHRIYYTKTKDFNTFTPTALFFEPGFSVIDATIVQDGEEFVMFVKDETPEPVAKKDLHVTKASNIEGPWEPLHGPITSNAYWAEGPTAIKINDKWHVYFDKYREKEYGVVTSTDLVNWTEESEKLQMLSGMRHGTIFKVDQEVLEKLLQL